MRRCYLVCYDIRDPKRLRQVHKTLKGYGEPWQYSVFFCVLKALDRVRLQSDLLEHIHPHEDQAMILDLGPNENQARQAVTVLGQPLPSPDSTILVI